MYHVNHSVNKTNKSFFKNLKPFIIFSSALVITGCAHNSFNSVPKEDIAYLGTEKPNNGTLTITRLEGVGAPCDILVMLDGELLAKFDTKETATFSIPPGKHELFVIDEWQGQGLCGKEKTEVLAYAKKIQLEIEPKEKYSYSIQRRGETNPLAALILGPGLLTATALKMMADNLSFEINKIETQTTPVTHFDTAQKYLTPKPNTAQITVKQTEKSGCNYAFLVNGERIARMKNSSEAVFYLPPGQNTVSVTWDWDHKNGFMPCPSNKNACINLSYKHSQEFVANQKYNIDLKWSQWRNTPVLDVKLVEN